MPLATSVDSTPELHMFCVLQARVFAQQPRGGQEGGAMTIRESGQAAAAAAPATNGSGADAEQMETDEDFARQLQAKMDAEEARRGCACRVHDLNGAVACNVVIRLQRASATVWIFRSLS